jgi:tRNA(Ile)-lysidine synthase
MRLAVGLSGGADSVALLCVLADRSSELGLVLHAAHLHHGLRGAEADADLAFSRELSEELGIPFHEARVDTAAEARRAPKTQTSDPADLPADSIEGTARRLRYAWFRQLLREVPLDAIATAHTLDDQAETVVSKFLRGAWTEGLSGIHPVLKYPEGLILRPVLKSTRTEIEAFLRSRNLSWREDSTNRHLTFTRNRIRHELLPHLETWNPQLREHLAQMADLARQEESWWQAETARMASSMILRGRPVRGGGRASTAAEGIALDLAQLTTQPVALQRRILRYVASQLECSMEFAATEALRTMALAGKAGQRLELARGLRAERTHRELRLTRGSDERGKSAVSGSLRYECVIPGVLDAPAFGCRIRLDFRADQKQPDQGPVTALLRSWRPGDRVLLRHSSGPRKVKEVLERMKVTGQDRATWPVLEVARCIRWMRGVEVEPDSAIRITVEPLESQAEEQTIQLDRDLASSGH